MFFKIPDCERCKFKKPKLHQNNLMVYDTVMSFFPLLISYAGGQANPSAEGIKIVLDEFFPDDYDRALNIYKIMVYISTACKAQQESEESKRGQPHAKEDINRPGS